MPLSDEKWAETWAAIQEVNKDRLRWAQEEREAQAIKELEEEFPDPEYTPEQIEAQRKATMRRTATKTISAPISLDNWEDLEELAHKKGQKMARLIRFAIKDYLVKNGYTRAY